MVVGFCSIGDWCYSEWCVWDLRTPAQLQGSEMSSALFQDYGWVCKTLRHNLLVFEHRVVLMTAGSHQDDPKFNPMGSQF